MSYEASQTDRLLANLIRYGRVKSVAAGLATVDFDGEVISEGVAIFNWTKIVACLKNEKLLQSSLIKISETLCKHQSFLLEYGNVNGFLGLGEGVLENDHYTDKNLELLFGEFIRFVDKNIAPKLNTNLPA